MSVPTTQEIIDAIKTELKARATGVRPVAEWQEASERMRYESTSTAELTALLESMLAIQKDERGPQLSLGVINNL